ncbi:MAG: cupin domain-containing protein [Verrucomicrobia bacterium]|nr:cupin domain-containing protein [Verrucomicrobiota bacterium]MCH8510537.1 cupin domain-containing protein [Kiritimatiellia bacterium]
MQRTAVYSVLVSLLWTAGTALHAGMEMEKGSLPYRGEGGHIMINAEDLEWGDVASMAPPAKIAVIEGDLSQEEPFTFRLKLPAGYIVAPHVHPAYERVTVIQGVFHFSHGKEFDREKTMALRVGGVAIMPPGDPMFGYTEEETIIQLHGTGPWGIEYLNSEDDPRNQ